MADFKVPGWDDGKDDESKDTGTKKRTADKQLTQLNYEEEEDSGKAQGSWTPASADVLAQRRIVTAKRPEKPKESNSNPFASISMTPSAPTAKVEAAPAAAAPATSDSAPAFAFKPASIPSLSFSHSPDTAKEPPKPTGFAAFAASSTTGFASSTPGSNPFASFAASNAGAAWSGAGSSSSPFSAFKQAPLFGQKKEDKDKDKSESAKKEGGDGDEDGGEVEGADVEIVPSAAAVTLPSVPQHTGEEDEVCVHKTRAKLFRLEGPEGPGSSQESGQHDKENDREKDNEEGAPAAEDKDTAEPKEPSKPQPPVVRWAERGVGQVHVNLSKADSGPQRRVRLVMRVEHVGRLILNVPLVSSMKAVEHINETSLRFTCIEASGPQTYLLRVKLPSEAGALADAINSHIPVDSEV